MKANNFLWCIILLISCSKKEDYSNMPVYLPGDTSNGSISIKKNGRDMVASTRVLMCNTLGLDDLVLFISTIDKNGYLAEDFVVYCFMLDTQHRRLCKDIDPACTRAVYYTKDDDIFLDRYFLNLNKNNFIELTEINLTTGWISGKLEMHFERDKSKPKERLDTPDNLSFTEGTFTAKLPE